MMRHTHSNSLCLLLVMLGAVSVSPAVAFSGQAEVELAESSKDKVATKEDFLAWIKRDAIHVQPWKMNPKLSRFLDEALNGKRILFIGEPGHFFKEKYDVQLMLIRYLATKGYRHIYLEGLGASMAPVIDRYVSTSSKPDASTEKGSGEAVEYRNRTLNGTAGKNGSEFKRRLDASQKRFFSELRAISQTLSADSGPLRIHPIDVDMMPGGCYHSISEVLDKYKKQESLNPIRKLAKKHHGQEPAQVVKRLEKLKELINDMGNANPIPITSTDWRHLRNYADCLLESSVFVVTRQEDGNMVRALVRREPAMFRQVKFAMDNMPSDAKAIMIAHHNHLTRIGADTSRARDPSVGEMICKTYPDQVYSIWMLHDHGTLLNPMSKQLIDTLESDPLRIESTMIQAGSKYLLPLHSGDEGERFIQRKRRYSYFTWDETGTLTKQADALFFLDEVSPLRE